MRIVEKRDGIPKLLQLLFLLMCVAPMVLGICCSFFCFCSWYCCCLIELNIEKVQALFLKLSYQLPFLHIISVLQPVL